MCKYRYSIIIPHKNCPELLERCLKSIPDRTDIQVIVVDDASNSVERIQDIEKEKIVSNLEVIYSNANKGAGAARNIGIGRCKGEWLLFADADDFFDKDAFAIFDDYSDTECDIIYFHHSSVYSDTLQECIRFNERNERIDNYLNNRSQNSSANLRYRDAVPWGKLFRYSLVKGNNFTFDEVPASNDVMFTTKCGNAAKQITADSRNTYIVTFRKGSLTISPSVNNMRARYEVMLRYSLFVRAAGHPEFQGRPLSAVFKAIRLFGLKEGVHYIKLANNYGVSLLTGFRTLHKSIYLHLKALYNRDFHKY